MMVVSLAVPEQGHRQGEMDPLRRVGPLHPVEAAGHERPMAASELLQFSFRDTKVRLKCELVGKHFPRGHVPSIAASGGLRDPKIAIRIPDPDFRTCATDRRTRRDQEVEPFEIVRVVVCGSVLDRKRGL